MHGSIILQEAYHPRAIHLADYFLKRITNNKSARELVFCQVTDYLHRACRHATGQQHLGLINNAKDSTVGQRPAAAGDKMDVDQPAGGAAAPVSHSGFRQEAHHAFRKTVSSRLACTVQTRIPYYRIFYTSRFRFCAETCVVCVCVCVQRCRRRLLTRLFVVFVHAAFGRTTVCDRNKLVGISTRRNGN
jgi:hypothetical protein